MKKNLFILLTFLSCLGLSAQDGAGMRRPISPAQPAWILHIDCWNFPDPEKIIALVPEDVLPFVIFNISLSSSDNITQDGPRILDSWLTVCAAHQVWCMIQPSSGAHNRLPEIAEDGTGVERYEHYLSTYPNCVGFSFAEQFWDFGANGCPTWDERRVTLRKLLELCAEYGSYLTMSFTQGYDNCLMMPMGILKTDEAFRTSLLTYADHFICTEKLTMKKDFYGVESDCFGMFLSGYAGHYGIRFDTSGWMSNTDSLNNASNNPYVESMGLMPILENLLLRGGTVMDGPELTWQQVTTSASWVTCDNWKVKNHSFFPHCVNLYIDLFRKVISGEWRIPAEDNVLSHTKIAVRNDFTSGSKNPYVTQRYLFFGLYRFDCDQGGVTYGDGWQDQRWWTKSTGRYPVVPMIYDTVRWDEPSHATDFIIVPQSELTTRWATRALKQTEFNALFPAISTGDLFIAARPLRTTAQERSTLLIYNPYQYCDTTIDGVRTFTNATRTATASLTLPLQGEEGLSIYLNNYRNSYSQSPYTESAQTTSTFVFSALSSEPALTWQDRGAHSPSTVTTSYDNGTYTLTVTHNGPVELTLSPTANSQQPTAQITLPPYTAGVITLPLRGAERLEEPMRPLLWTGGLQLETENFDYQGSSVTIYRKPGDCTLSDYYGQGYVTCIPKTTTRFRDSARVAQAGIYHYTLRYRSNDTGSPVPLTLLVNNQTVTLPATTRSADWQTLTADLSLTEGTNELILGFSSSWQSSTISLDCIRLDYLAPLPSSIEASPTNVGGSLRYTVLGQPVSNSYNGIIVQRDQKTLRLPP